jgi:serine/threonine protein kinase/dipeptidyl aminopeptidase/acylaminoacyl peptidase
MALTTGTKLGPYEIQLPLGVGGMGEVYRASDPRLKRSVAIKILPSDVSSDPERLARFQREAQVLASLNHPNVASIYGVEESDGIRALVMELVEGQTLSERLRKGPVPFDEFASLAKQLVEALDAAHEKGIVHRDLKPANIKITPLGTLKVLDFGLAKAVDKTSPETDPNSSPTLTAITQGPTILGTAAYMSPEQARGRFVDQRTDIWSFGCVLFEMLAGQRPFSGDTVTDILASIIRSDAEWSSLPADTSRPLRRLLRRCLEKDPRRRLQNIGDARFELEDAERDEPEPAASVPARSRFLWIGWATATVLALAVLRLGFVLGRVPELPLLKIEIIVPAFNPDFIKFPVISPDGQRIAYYAGGHLWIRELNQFTARQLPDADDTWAFFWSPNGAHLGYGARKKLWKVAAQGGPSTAICDVPDTGEVLSGAWGTKGTIALSVWRGSVYEVPATGGVAKLLMPVNGTEVDFHNLSYLPDGKTLLFKVHAGGNEPGSVSALSGRSRKVILEQPQHGILTAPIYSPSGHLLYTRGTGMDYSIWAVPFSTSSLGITGEPFVVAATATFPTVADDGTLLYVPNRPKLRQLVWAGHTGNVEAQIGSGQDLLEAPSLSPDGHRAAVSTEDNNAIEIWIYDLSNGAHHRLTFSDRGTAAVLPVWSPAGDKIAFSASRNANASIRVIGVDGSGNKQIVAGGTAGSFTPDGKAIAYTSQSAKGKADLWYVNLDGSGAPVSLLNSDANESSPQIAPNGRFVVYVSDESGRDEVYVRPFPTGDGKWQVSTAGGSMPHWSARGSELLFVHEDELMGVEVAYTPSFTLSSPHKLFSTKVIDLQSGYAVARDGQHFLAVQEVDPKKSGGGPMVLVQNWYSEFKKK